MQYVLTFTTDPAGPKIVADQIIRVAETLGQQGDQVGAIDWLSPGVACDLACGGIDPDKAADLVREALGAAPIDVNAIPTKGRRKRLLIADMDSTIITGESLDELADFVGLRAPIAAITARAMRGELDFEDALRERVGMLKGLGQDKLDALLDLLELTSGAATLVATMKANGAYCALVSGGFDFATGHIRALIGFDLDRSNRLELKDGALTGNVIPPILDKQSKLDTLAELCTQLGIQMQDAATIGDGANDIPMLEAAGLGCAFHAKPAVTSAAQYRLDHSDLTGLLFLQGYRAEQLVG
jgi:phosphoserine phosphatase